MIKVYFQVMFLLKRKISFHPVFCTFSFPDFGLSNTMMTPSSEGHTAREFLKTQCGSPAYAAPEILGHKPYGPEVDIWSIGVNMYAMLTGKLPYTAEPFHITTLYNKMKNNDMNPIPEHLSPSCKDLIRRFLTFNREQRITLEEALGHEWLRKGYDGPVIPVLFPNYPRDDELDKNILRHMTIKMEFEQQEIINAVTQNRATSSATVYHLLRRKLKKYYINHPAKAQRTTNAESIKDNIESVKNYWETNQEKENKNQAIKRPECSVATVVACDFDDKDEKTLKEEQEVNDSESKKLKVPICRRRLSSQSQENLSASNEELTENKTSNQNERDTEKLNDETDAAENDETCNVLSNTGIEISRKNSLNYSSVEVMAVKGHRLSLNLSHISLESKVTAGQQSLKNTSGENFDVHGDSEKQEPGESALKHSPGRVDIMPSLTSQDKTSKSPRHPGPNAPSISKVSLINAKIISIPLQQSKQDSSDKVKLPQRRFSLPQSFLPSKNLGTNQQKQPVTSPFSFSSSTEGKQRSKESSVLPPYGLCCQLTAIKSQDESSDPESRAKEDKSHGEHAAAGNGLDSRHAQTRRNMHCPTSTDKEQQRWKRHSLGTPGGRELLKSINNTLGRLMDLQEKTDPFKAHGQDNLLLRSRLPPATLNGPLKREAPMKDVKLSLIQENVGVKEKKNHELKISCRVKDSHPHQKPQDLSNFNSEAHSTKEKLSRESRQNKSGLHDRAARRRRRRTMENKVSSTANQEDQKLIESASLQRHLRDEKRKTTHEASCQSRDSPEEFI